MSPGTVMPETPVDAVAPAARVDVVVFDIGNVLLDWDPRHLYRDLIADPAERERFLAEICPPGWNLEQDRGRPWEAAIAERVALFPQHAALIRAFREEWHRMVAGVVPGSVELLAALRTREVPLYAITNFAADTFEECVPRFPFLRDAFLDVVVSAHVGLVKPDPAIYRLLLERNGLAAARCLFVDDSPANVRAAEGLGMHAHHFRDAAGLEAVLRGAGLLG
jgi:2-haloacid dehalogenase